MKQIKKLSVFKVREGILKTVLITPTPKLFISRAGFDFYLYQNTNKEYAIIEGITGQNVGYISRNKEEVIRIAHQSFDTMSDDRIRECIFKCIESHGFVEGYHMNHIPIEVQQKGKKANLLIKEYQKHIERLKLIEPDPFMMDWGITYPNKPLETLIFQRNSEGLRILNENQLDCLWYDEVHELNYRVKFLVEYLEPDFVVNDWGICNGRKGLVIEILTYDWYNNIFWYLIDFEGDIRECLGSLCFKVK